MSLEKEVATSNDELRERKNAVFGAPPGAPAAVSAALGSRPPELSIEVPTECVPLPSLGKVYPADSALCNAETIDIKAMTTKEEDILTSRALIKKGVVVTHLLQSCILDKRINVLDMLSGDRNAIMVAIRVTGYGVDYDAEIECGNPECGVKKERTFNLADLVIKRLNIEPVQPNTNLFQFKLPYTKHVVNFKFLTGSEEEDIASSQERMKKQGMPTDTLVTSRLLYAIQAVNNVTDRNQISRFVRNMPARDSRDLRSYIDQNEPGIEMKQTTACPLCGHEEEVAIPMGVNFFWPSK